MAAPGHEVPRAGQPPAGHEWDGIQYHPEGSEYASDRCGAQSEVDSAADGYYAGYLRKEEGAEGEEPPVLCRDVIEILILGVRSLYGLSCISVYLLMIIPRILPYSFRDFLLCRLI